MRYDKFNWVMVSVSIVLFVCLVVSITLGAVAHKKSWKLERKLHWQQTVLQDSDVELKMAILALSIK